MPGKDLPQPFGVDEINFMSCFTAPSLRHFVLLMKGWVLTVGLHTVSRVILTMRLDEPEHFGSVYRFFSRALWNLDHVGSKIFLMIVDGLVPAGSEVVVILDDTLNKHRGKKIAGAGWQHDGSAPKHSKRKGYGLCFVIIGVAVRLPDISERVLCLPFAARLWWPANAKVKPQGMLSSPKTELGADLIKLARSWLPEDRRLRVVADISYTCKRVIESLPEGTSQTGRVRMDSSLYEVAVCPLKRPRGRPRTKGKRLPTPKEMFSDQSLNWRPTTVVSYGKKTEVLVYEFYALWYHTLGSQIVLFVLVHDLSGAHADAVFLETDCLARPKQIVGRYSSRWSIEITIRETKQLLGSAEPQCRTEKAVRRTPMMAYWAYSLVVLWFVSQFNQGKRLMIEFGPWYGHKKNVSFADMLACARRSHFTVAFSREARQHRDLSKNRFARSTRQPHLTERAKL